MIIFSQGWPLYISASISGIMVAGFCWAAFRPRKFASNQNLEEAANHGPYRPENVLVDHVYNIWCPRTHTRQEFAVLDKGTEWFRVGVYPMRRDPQKRRRFVFRGWAREIPNDRHIEVEDLLPYNPKLQRGAWDRLASSATEN